MLTLKMRAYTELSPVTLTLQVASVPLGLVSMQAPLISCSTRSAKLSFFQKAVAVVVIVEFKTTRMEGVYARDELNIRANAPSPLLSKVVSKKGGGVFRELTVYQFIVSRKTSTSQYMYRGMLE